jgi:hypothetical protein
VHPNKFFNEVNLRTGIDTFEIFDNDLKAKLSELHPLNFIKTNITLPVYEVVISYTTSNGNYKKTSKYMVLNNTDEDELSDMYSDMLVRDYTQKYNLKNCQISEIKHICDAVLQIG